MRKTTWAIPIAVLALLSSGALLNAKQAKGDETGRPEIQKMLSRARVEATQLKDDLEVLQTLTSTEVSWDSHVTMLNQIRDDINVIGRDLQRLEEVRDDATVWQRTAIDQMRPALAEMAANTQAIIDRVNKNPKLVGTPEYKDYVLANADAAASFARMIGDYVEYGRGKERMDRLSNQHEIPPSQL